MGFQAQEKPLSLQKEYQALQNIFFLRAVLASPNPDQMKLV